MEQFTETKDRELPGFGITLFTILLPVILMLLATIVDLILPETNGFRQVVDFIGSPIIALFARFALFLLFFWICTWFQQTADIEIYK